MGPFRTVIVAVLVLAFAGALVSSFGVDDTGDYIHYRLGVKYKRERDYDRAIEEFRKVLAAYPDNYNAYMHLAEIRADQNQSRLVIYNLKKALTYNPGWGKAHRLLADAYEHYGQYQNAIVQLQQYQQTCDPSERDSVQAKIGTLVKLLSGEEMAQSVAPEKPSDSGEDVEEVTAQKASTKSKSSTSQKPKGTHAAPVSAEREAKAVEEFNLAVAAYGEGDMEKSIEHVRNCLRAQPGHAGAYYYAGLIRRKQGQNEMARINFERSLSYPELGYNAHFYLGKIYAGQGQYPTAIAHLESYIDATDYDAGKEQARALIENYKTQVSRKVEPKKVVDIKKIGEQDLKSEVERIEPEPPKPPIEVRIDELLSMVMVDTLTDEGRRTLKGVKFFKEGRFDDAVREFKDVLVKYPRGQVAMHCLYNIGVCYMKMRLFADAENQFQQVIDRFPRNELAARSLFLKGLTYQERKDPQVADQVFRAFIRHNRTHQWTGKAYEQLGDAYMDLETPKKAADSYNQAAALARTTLDKVYALYKLGTAYFTVDNYPKGIESFKEAISKGESDGVYERIPDSYYRIADHYYREKNFKDALKYYTRVTRKYPGFQETPWGMFQIGNIYRNDNDYNKAIEAYKQLIADHPDDYWARQAQWKMEDTIWENEYQAILR